MTKTQEDAVRRHGENLLAIFPHATEKNPVRLCRALHRWESRGATLALRLCNGPAFPTEDQQERTVQTILKAVNTLLGNECVPIFVNLDPRGCALKIDDEWLRDQCQHNQYSLGDAFRALHKDWGGYGIICPEIGKNGR